MTINQYLKAAKAASRLADEYTRLSLHLSTPFEQIQVATAKARELHELQQQMLDAAHDALMKEQASMDI